MTWKHYLLTFLLSVCIFSLISIFQDSPGYMDAEYYYSMGLRIARDGSLSEPFLWNYLHYEDKVPHPGFTYWMPLPSFIAAAGMSVSGLYDFKGAQIISILITSFIPVITMAIAYDLSKSKFTASLASAFSLFPSFYLPYLGTTDSFSLLMILGGLFFLIIKKRNIKRTNLVLGVVAGLFHLTRADGLIWLAAVLIAVNLTKEKKLHGAVQVLIGYLIVMGPWYARNWISMGEVLPTGATRMIWLTNYNDLFIFQTSGLTVGNWIKQGIDGILNNIASAFISNMKTVAIVQGQIILSPLAFIGLKRHWKDPAVRSSAFAYGMIFFVMTAIFPFAGWRGGFLHSGTALQPLIWALGSIGFADLMDLGVKKRAWQKEKANRMFGVSLIVLLMCTTVFVYWDRVVGKDRKAILWNQSFRVAEGIGKELSILGATQNDLIMINNPPGLYAATGLSSIVIPNGDVSTMIDAAQILGADYIVLEKNHPDSLNSLYQDPDRDDRLELLNSKDGIHYFLIE